MKKKKTNYKKILFPFAIFFVLLFILSLISEDSIEEQDKIIEDIPDTIPDTNEDYGPTLEKASKYEITNDNTVNKLSDDASYLRIDGSDDPLAGKEIEEFDINGFFWKTFEWSYSNNDWYIKIPLSKEIYDFYGLRERVRDYDLFASDPYDDELITLIANTFVDMGKKNNLDDYETARLVVSFVQSLEYTSDEVTTGFDEYPRFPYETLYDEGGDCEDTSILVASLLQEMGYGVVLIIFPQHMAVGVLCEEEVGSYYNYEGRKYCYLETTGEGWDFGEVPEEYVGESARLLPIIKKPFLDIDFNSVYEYNYYDTYVDVNVTINNLGSEIANNVIVYVALQTLEEDMVWDQIESEYLTIEPEEGYIYTVQNLHAPSTKAFRIYILAYGDNVISDEAYTNWVENY